MTRNVSIRRFTLEALEDRVVLSHGGPEIIPGQYIATLQPGVDAREFAEEVRGLGRDVLHVYSHALNGLAFRGGALANDPRIATIEPDRVHHIEAQVLPTGVDRIEVDKNPNASNVPINQDIAIIDSGIDLTHPDLNVASAISFAGGSGNDQNGHGTHVAGTAAGIDNGIGVTGVAPGARLHAVKVCKPNGSCLTSDMVAGIDHVSAQKAEAHDGDGDPGVDFAVANMSISTPDDATPCSVSSGAIHQAICGLVDEGVVFTLAAGNNGRVKNAFPEALTVAAIADFDGKGGGQGSATCRSDVDETLANFSNYGPQVDIAAPGTCITSTWKNGGTNTISGTSMAAPHVAGAVALYLHSNNLQPATNAAGVDAIEAVIIGAALPEGTASNPCSYDNERESSEPLLFVNGTEFGGDGSCDVAGPVTPVTDIAITSLSAPSSAEQGDNVSIDVSVENVGNQDVGTDILVSLDESPDDFSFTNKTISGGLVAGESTTVTFSWDTTSASLVDHLLIATHNVTDDNNGNNSDSTTVTILAPSAGVTVSSITPDTMAGGDTVGVTITGTGFATGADVDFQGCAKPPTASNVIFSGGNTITADVFAKKHKFARTCDVVVTVGGASGTLSDGFTVTVALRASGVVANSDYAGAGLTQSVVGPVVREAIKQWSVAGVDENRLKQIEQIDVRIDTLAGNVLAEASPQRIVLDRDAAGYGWFSDLNAADSALSGRFDLLSVVIHEFGHALGFDHDLMGATLEVGVRDLDYLDSVRTELDSRTEARQTGDSNGDGQFDQRDLVAVLQNDKYLTGQPAAWSQGDWNGDGRFDQMDIVAALQEGQYLANGNEIDSALRSLGW